MADGMSESSKESLEYSFTKLDTSVNTTDCLHVVEHYECLFWQDFEEYNVSWSGKRGLITFLKLFACAKQPPLYS